MPHQTVLQGAAGCDWSFEANEVLPGGYFQKENAYIFMQLWETDGSEITIRFISRCDFLILSRYVWTASTFLHHC